MDEHIFSTNIEEFAIKYKGDKLRFVFNENDEGEVTISIEGEYGQGDVCLSNIARNECLQIAQAFEIAAKMIQEWGARDSE